MSLFTGKEDRAVETAPAMMLSQEEMFVGGDRQIIPVSSNPFTWQNMTGKLCLAVISGGVVNTISISRDGTNFDALGLLSGCYVIGLNDRVRITYTLTPPTFTLYPL